MSIVPCTQKTRNTMIIPVFKPAGATSHDVVDRVRASTGVRRVGHAGTLDPFAEGVLVVGIGRESTRKLGSIAKGTDKEYIAVAELGVETETGDPEGARRRAAPEEFVASLSREDIAAAAVYLTGDILQEPPAYSAKKIKGVSAFRLARRGIQPKLPPVPVHVSVLDILSWDPPFLKMRIVCSSGTYIRSIARDLGRRLGAGAHLLSLLRTRVGPWRLEDAVPPERVHIAP